jgi:hypothetical protein
MMKLFAARVRTRDYDDVVALWRGAGLTQPKRRLSSTGTPTRMRRRTRTWSSTSGASPTDSSTCTTSHEKDPTERNHDRSGREPCPTPSRPVDEVVKHASAAAEAFGRHGMPVVLVTVGGAPSGRTEQARSSGQLPAGWADLVPELNQQPETTRSRSGNGKRSRTWASRST